MSDNARRRNILIAIIILIIIAIILFLTRCQKPKPAPTQNAGTPPAAPTNPPPASTPTTETPATPPPDERLTAATLTAPERVDAGAVFSVSWTGPDNTGDFVTVVARDATPQTTGSYQETKDGKSLRLTAPIDPGAYEVRYITTRTRTILARVPVEVVPTGATLDAVPEVILGTTFTVRWTGPNNDGDYVTVVAKGEPDDKYASYAETRNGNPATLTAPTITGECEIRYVTGQAGAAGRKVLARRPIKVIATEVSLTAPAEAVAGATIEVAWIGPNGAGDYVTIVTPQAADDQYTAYANTAAGSPAKLLIPIMTGDAELRYVTGQGRRVLHRRPIKIVAAVITMTAPREVATGAEVSITWTGPNHGGDYITIVPKGTPDGQYGAYANTTSGSPLKVKAPKEAGDAEIRYASGQGNKVLARIAIKVTP